MVASRSRRVDERLTVLVCRGCCCGTLTKHPEVDHAGHLLRIQRALGDVSSAKLFVVDCLDQCERSNVVVVRAAGERTWFGEMLDDTSVALFAEWLTGDGVGAVPAALEAHRFDPDARPLGQMEMDARSGAELVEWAHELVAGGGWIVGVPGGVVEVHAGDGAVPLLLTDDTRAFTIVGPREPAVPVVIVFAAIIAVPGNGIPALPLGLQIPKGFVVRAVHFPTA